MRTLFISLAAASASVALIVACTGGPGGLGEFVDESWRVVVVDTEGRGEVVEARAGDVALGERRLEQARPVEGTDV